MYSQEFPVIQTPINEPLPRLAHRNEMELFNSSHPITPQPVYSQELPATQTPINEQLQSQNQMELFYPSHHIPNAVNDFQSTLVLAPPNFPRQTLQYMIQNNPPVQDNVFSKLYQSIRGKNHRM